ncbi:MAG: TolC family protein, partial [Nitrospinota bacterium]
MVAITHHLRFLCGMLALGLLPACATVGVRKAPPPLPADPFERALMAYVRGDLEQATADLQEVIRSHPEDLRARDLLQAVYQEKGGSLALSPPPPLTLLLPQPASPERIMQIVLGRNPEIRKAIFQIIEARARLREAQVDFGPEFSLLTRFHPLGVFTTLTQSILDGIWGRKARMHQAEESLLASVANYTRVRMAILDSALNSYLQFLEAEELIEVLKAELQVREEQRRVASLRSQHGTLLSPDLLAIEQGLAATQQKLAEARKSLEVARTTLNGLMGRRVDAPLSLQPKRVVVAVPEDVRQAITRARSQRPELQEAQAQLAEAQAGHEIIRTRLPRIELRTTYGASSREGRGDFFMGSSTGLRFSTPLLIWPLQKARSAREAALVKQLEMEVAAWQTRLAVEAVEAYQKLQEAQKRFVTAVKQSEEAREALRIARAVDRWGKGEERFTLLAAQIKQSEAHQQLIRRDYAIQRASLQLQRVMGTLPERVIFTSPAPNRQEEDRSPRPHPDRALWAWHPAFLQEPQE